MKLVNFIRAGVPGVGRLVDDMITSFAGLADLDAASLPSILGGHSSPDGDTFALAEVTMRPVITNPARIVCVGLNYRSHVTETKRELPTYPVLFTKFASSLIGHRAAIQAPREVEQLDFEAELAVVIGKAGRRIPASEAAGHIAGFAVANDVTARDYQYLTHQWFQGKSWDRSTPIGPYLVTADEFEGPSPDLRIALSLNGEVMQDASTGSFIFDVPTLVQKISEFTELQPGDIILTGTPGGVGFRRDPQVFLQPGDEVRVSIENVGELVNSVERED